MIGQLCKIGHLTNKQKLYGGFAHLYRFTRKTMPAIGSGPSRNTKTSKLETLPVAPAPDNPLLIQKIEALIQSKQAAETEIAAIANKAESKRGEANNNNEERSHQIGLLSQQNEQMKVVFKHVESFVGSHLL